MRRVVMGRVKTRGSRALRVMFCSMFTFFISRRTAGVTSQLLELSSLLPPFISDNFDEIVEAATKACEALPLELLFSGQFRDEMVNVKIVEVTASTRRTYYATVAHQQLIKVHPSSLLIYIPGWWNTADDESSSALTDALIQKYHTVLILNTREAFSRGYVAAASRVPALSHVLYQMIRNFIRSGIPLESIRLLGFSLGAQVAGTTGKLLLKRLNKRLEWITALDPAKPCFTKNSLISKRDAKFVHVIHSSAVLGVETRLGHLDVYMNGVDVTQPECEDMKVSFECDHAQSWKKYTLSVLNDSLMMGQRCFAWRDLQRGRCNGTKAVVGFGVHRDTRGLYLYQSVEMKKRNDKKLKLFSVFDFVKKLLMQY